MLAACGPATPEVRVVMTDDDSLPCLGAKHIKIEVNLRDGNYYVWDRFAASTYFHQTTHRCTFDTEFRYDRLALSPSTRIDVSIQDSTTGPTEEHILAVGSTVTFAVTESSPTQEWIIQLSRKAETRLGTAYLTKPNDWGNIQGIHHMEFAVYEETDQGIINTIRSHQLAFDRSTFSEPWPIIISNLPADQVGKLYRTRITSLDAERETLRTWIGEVYIQAYQLGWVNWIVR